MTLDEKNVLLDALRHLGLAILADGAAPWDGAGVTERDYMDKLLSVHRKILMEVSVD